MNKYYNSIEATGGGEQEMTVREAIAAGYKYYTSDQFDCQYPLKKAKDHADFSYFQWVLVDKNPTLLTVSADDIYQDLLDNFAINRDIDDDSECFSDIIVSSVDWDKVVEQLNAALAARPVYYVTEIKLKP